MAPPSLAELRQQAVARIEATALLQKSHWDSLTIEIHAAAFLIHGRASQILQAKIAELSTANAYPIWMDALLAIGTSLIPVNRITDRIAQRLAVSRQLPRLVPDFGARQRFRRVDDVYKVVALDSPAALKATMKAPSPKLEELRELWFEAGRVLRPELEDGLRATITAAAKATIEPLYDKEVLTPGSRAQKEAMSRNTGLPAATVYKSLLQWVAVSQGADEHILKLLSKFAETTDDEECLKLIPAFLDHERFGVTRRRHVLEKAPDEYFQRFVEACLWCSTYDFTPTFKPGRKFRRHHKIEGWETLEVKPSTELLALPEPIWSDLVKRHYDPFSGQGDQTYADVGYARHNVPAGVYLPAPNAATEEMLDTRTFDPRTRLSIHWSSVLAPAILRENKEIAEALEMHLPRQS